MKNDFNYKWSKIFAFKRYETKNGVIKLDPKEQQELLDDSHKTIEEAKKIAYRRGYYDGNKKTSPF